MSARREAAPTPTAPPTVPPVDVLDALPREGFTAAVSPLFEGAPAFLGRLADARPFGSIDRFFDVARAIAHSMPVVDQIELIDAHPRLGAPPQAVSPASYVEQGYAAEAAARAAVDGEERRAPVAPVAADLERLNTAYEARFGFRYCVFVAGRPRAALLPDMTAALDAVRDAEIHRALDAVVDIAMDRYAKTRDDSGGTMR